MKDFIISYMEALNDLHTFFTNNFTFITSHWVDLKFIIMLMLAQNREFIKHNDRESFQRFFFEAKRYREVLTQMSNKLPEKRESFVGYSKYLAKLRETNIDSTTTTLLQNFYTTYDKQTKMLWDLVIEYTESINKQLKYIDEITLSKGGVQGTVRLVDDNQVSEWEQRAEKCIDDGIKIHTKANSVITNLTNHLRYMSTMVSAFLDTLSKLHDYYKDLFDDLSNTWVNIKLIIPLMLNDYEEFLIKKDKDAFLKFSDEVNNYRLELLRLSNILEQSTAKASPIKQSLQKLKLQSNDPYLKPMINSFEDEFMTWFKEIAKIAADYRGTIDKMSSTVDSLVDETNRIKIKDMKHVNEWRENSENLWEKGHKYTEQAHEKLVKLNEEIGHVRYVIPEFIKDKEKAKQNNSN